VTISISKPVKFFYSRDPLVGFPDPSDCTDGPMTFCDKPMTAAALEVGLWKIYLLFTSELVVDVVPT
jgi:hypothetical protein